MLFTWVFTSVAFDVFFGTLGAIVQLFGQAFVSFGVFFPEIQQLVIPGTFSFRMFDILLCSAFGNSIATSRSGFSTSLDSRFPVGCLLYTSSGWLFTEEVFLYQLADVV